MIVVWFSCGAASAVALKKTLEIYGGAHEVRAVNTPIANEHSDNLRFRDDVAKWCGVEIESASNPKYPLNDITDLFARRKFMSGPRGAICTETLKKEARYAYERQHSIAWHVFGFTKDEQKRHDNFVLAERSNVLPVLIDLHITKADCLDIVEAAGLQLPAMYALGFPNANCIGCVKASSPSYWNHVRATFPEVFKERAVQSRQLGCRLTRVKNKRLYLDELPPDARGRPLKSLRMPDCGIFCEERVR